MRLQSRHPEHIRSVGAPRLQAGVSMIEVLIAVLIMGIGLLGMAAMQTTALRNSQSALERSQAAMHTYALLDTMRANVDQARIGAYNLAAWTCGPPADDGTLVRNDLNNWFEKVQENTALGDTTCAAIQCDTQQCLVQVRWNDSRGTGGDEEQTFTTETRL
jgi:type IV pilus assembly protein PilV